MKKKIDERIRILIENCVKLNQRGLVIMIGDRSVYQVSTHLNQRNADSQLALHAVQSKDEGPAQHTMVLQEGAGVLQSQKEEAEADQEAGDQGKPGQGGGQSD